MDLGLRGRIALVCGGSRGIGYATAEELAREGATVIICGRDDASLKKAQVKLAKMAKIAAIQADLSTTEGVAAAIATVKARFEHVDILVTNTGGPLTGDVLSHDWAAWESAIGLLLRSAVELSRAFVPGMRERKWGRVIGITSLAVKRPETGLVLSNSIRAAVTGYFRTLADEVAADGVTVNTVLPGYTETERLTALAEANAKRTGTTPEAVFRDWMDKAPAKRLGRPEELAAAITFLASDRAGYITGQALLVDGGAIRLLF